MEQFHRYKRDHEIGSFFAQDQPFDKGNASHIEEKRWAIVIILVDDISPYFVYSRSANLEMYQIFFDTFGKISYPCLENIHRS